MDQATHNKIVSFIWGIADDVMRDLFKRGKYPEVILWKSVNALLVRIDAVRGIAANLGSSLHLTSDSRTLSAEAAKSESPRWR